MAAEQRLVAARAAVRDGAIVASSDQARPATIALQTAGGGQRFAASARACRRHFLGGPGGR
eukprot:13520118-Alexandrium_andersonii.AAC.1